MIEKKDRVSIQDNFLPKEEFVTLRDTIMDEASTFPWYFNTRTVDVRIEKELTPGLFTHIVYDRDVPHSEFYHQFPSILERMNVEVLTRIKVNLQTRLPEPDFAMFHSDTMFNTYSSAQWITSIFYVNTNNGYTELENGQKIESVANRLVSFPSNIEHRGVSQTDEQTRVLININYYLKNHTLPI